MREPNHTPRAGEVLDDLVGELVDGVARVGRLVDLGDDRRVAARDDEQPTFDLARRRFHLHHHLRADTGTTAPTKTRGPRLAAGCGNDPGSSTWKNPLTSASRGHRFSCRARRLAVTFGARTATFNICTHGVGQLSGRADLLRQGRRVSRHPPPAAHNRATDAEDERGAGAAGSFFAITPILRFL
jgi:hypothetical protein